MTDAHKIAAGLTKAQRQAMRHQARGCYSHELGRATTGTIKALNRRGLIDCNDFLTSLGLAVRAIIQEQDHDA